MIWVIVGLLVLAVVVGAIAGRRGTRRGGTTTYGSSDTIIFWDSCSGDSSWGDGCDSGSGD